MTTKTIHYDTRTQMETGKDREVDNGFRALHTDFTNNNQADGYDVFYDDAPDAPPPPKRQLTRTQFEDELADERNIELV